MVRTETSAVEEDNRSKTILPYMAACFAIVSGVALASYALGQIQSSNILITALGVWNTLVSLAYVWLAVQLARRAERAYVSGMLLSIGNIVFIFFQLSFWNTMGMAAGFSENERAEIIGAAPFVFLLTDMFLAAAVYFSFRDLVHPVSPQDVPDSDLLQRRLGEAQDEQRYRVPVQILEINDRRIELPQDAPTTTPPRPEEIEVYLDLRRTFLADMKSNARGGAELDVTYEGETVDLAVMPLLSYLQMNSGGKNHRYLFYPMITSLAELERLRKSAHYIIAISAMPNVIKQTRRGKESTGLYLIRNGLWVAGGSSRSKAFENVAARSYGLKFETYRPTSPPPEEDHGLPRYG